MVVLLDEPFSNLDSALRIHMREQVQQIVEQAQATTVLVTHDQEEALSLADVVVIMFAGCVAQVGTPQQIYRTPVSKQVAEFVGEANWLSAEAHGHSALCSLGEIQLRHSAIGPVDLLIRPEAVQIFPDPAGAVSIAKVRYVGHSQYIELRLPNGGYLGARGGPNADYVPGMLVNVRIIGPLMAYSA
jgi:iron(III) transport system ATP-binding protein